MIGGDRERASRAAAGRDRWHPRLPPLRRVGRPPAHPMPADPRRSRGHFARRRRDARDAREARVGQLHARRINPSCDILSAKFSSGRRGLTYSNHESFNPVELALFISLRKEAGNALTLAAYRICFYSMVCLHWLDPTTRHLKVLRPWASLNQRRSHGWSVAKRDHDDTTKHTRFNGADAICRDHT
jgi:hypothetical protein